MSLNDFDPAYISLREENGIVIVSFRLPRLSDDENIEQMGQELFALVDQYDCKKIVVSLGTVEYITSSAIGKLITLHRRLHRIGGMVVICDVRGTVAESLKTSRLLDYFNIADDVSSAVPLFN